MAHPHSVALLVGAMLTLVVCRIQVVPPSRSFTILSAPHQRARRLSSVRGYLSSVLSSTLLGALSTNWPN